LRDACSSQPASIYHVIFVFCELCDQFALKRPPRTHCCRLWRHSCQGRDGSQRRETKSSATVRRQGE